MIMDLMVLQTYNKLQVGFSEPADLHVTLRSTKVLVHMCIYSVWIKYMYKVIWWSTFPVRDREKDPKKL